MVRKHDRYAAATRPRSPVPQARGTRTVSWKSLSLGEALSVKHGFAFKSTYFSDRGSHLVLTPGNFHEHGGFRLRPGKNRWYTGDFPDEYILGERDIIVAMTEQGPGLLGSSAVVPEDNLYLHNQRLGLVTDLDESVLDRRFTYYLFNTRGVRAQINSSASGTKVRHTSPGRICNVRVRVPCVESQARIAGILSTYDTLVENNRRRMALLEQAARELYREWFVRLRFPGHESTKIVDGLPEGWKRKAAIDVADVMSGGTPRTAVPRYWDGSIPFFTPKDATDSVYACETEKTLTEEGLNNCNSPLYQKDTIFLTARGTVGKVNLAQSPMAMNQSCYALSGKGGLGQVFLYFALVEGVEHLRRHAVGAVFDAIIVDTFRRIPFVEPPKSLILAFNSLSAPAVEEIDKLATQNRCLARARDLLLPQLMSGELAV